MSLGAKARGYSLLWLAAIAADGTKVDLALAGLAGTPCSYYMWRVDLADRLTGGTKYWLSQHSKRDAAELTHAAAVDLSHPSLPDPSGTRD